jgi:Crinkler effector protein N-terminal domain
MCMFEGCTFDKTFHIFIDFEKTVNDLIQAVKEESRFKYTLLDEITLYSVDIPLYDSEKLEEFRRQDDSSKNTVKMDPTTKLSEYFDGNEKSFYVHVIIETPVVSIFYYFIKKRKHTSC